jgi:hypothetical protein
LIDDSFPVVVGTPTTVATELFIDSTDHDLIAFKAMIGLNIHIRRFKKDPKVEYANHYFNEHYYLFLL